MAAMAAKARTERATMERRIGNARTAMGKNSGDLRITLVSRFRNSHDLYIGLQANFGIEGHQQLIESSVVWFRSSPLRLISIIWRASKPRHLRQDRVGQGISNPDV